MKMPLLAAALLFLALPAHAERTPEEKIALLLSAHHELPPRAVFERFVPEAKVVLVSFARRTELFPPYRNRALEALSMWPDDDIRRLYLDLLADPGTPDPTKHRILLLVPRVFGEETPRILEPWRTHPEASFRATAITALGRSRPALVR